MIGPGGRVLFADVASEIIARAAQSKELPESSKILIDLDDAEYRLRGLSLESHPDPAGFLFSLRNSLLRISELADGLAA